MDEAFVGALFNAVGTNATYKSLSRIGKTDPNKNRPIKLVMNSEEDKSKIMNNLSNLKDNESFAGVSVSDDYTVKQRQTIKEWTEKAKGNNSNESPNSKFTWKVRGDSKKGWSLKKVLKQKRVVLQS